MIMQVTFASKAKVLEGSEKEKKSMQQWTIDVILHICEGRLIISIHLQVPANLLSNKKYCMSFTITGKLTWVQ